ncbi:hypothetical protein BD311DRAFT_749320 [Dichomitus squalens]|uniref:Uncharacterized protein n=1 Tax=Dichomitus squalens TaxID=114155 RepID=A0A4Q9N058_9APHY|nr:hypothetical protein BD311DRAFT_749320 [Dichomitus squalens]
MRSKWTWSRVMSRDRQGDGCPNKLCAFLLGEPSITYGLQRTPVPSTFDAAALRLPRAMLSTQVAVRAINIQ